MRIKLFTLGCKVNQFESQAIEEGIKKKGHSLVSSFDDDFDVFIINTCAVTSRACYQARQAIRKAIRRNPHAKVIVTGCYAQIAPWEIVDSVDASVCVIGNDQKTRLLDLEPPSMECLEIFVGDIFKQSPIHPFSLSRPQGERTRAYLRVQDGCDAFCSYCIVPYARGRSKSLSLNRAIEQVKRYDDAGIKEVVVTGTHIGCYGKDLADKDLDLLSLIDTLSSRFRGIRFRLSSIEPKELTDGLISLIEERDNICKHLHIPLQSGSKRVLRAMSRDYDPEMFIEKTLSIRRLMPDASIGADVLVGFCNEEEQDFLKTIEVIEKSPVTYLHVFPFSKRPGTRAYGFKETVDKKEKKRRCKAIREIGYRKKMAFYSSFIGRDVVFLPETIDYKRGAMSGYTENYLYVCVDIDRDFGRGMDKDNNEVVVIEGLINKEAVARVEGISKEPLFLTGSLRCF